MAVCDYCKEEKELTKYIFPKVSRKSFNIDDNYMKFIGPITIEPEEVEICEDCALKIYHKMNWLG